jgi:CubicO group peptidase (beta-lactamase class C family)
MSEASHLGIRPLPETTVTRDNWRTWPHSVWAFQHLREMLPSKIVPASPDPRPLPRRKEDIAGILFEDEFGALTSWDEFLARTHADAMLVLQDGAVLFETYRNGMNARTPHMLFSVTKSVVGLLAELLADDGAIDLSRSASAYVPELTGSAFGSASLHALLDMRDGVPFDENYADPNAAIHSYSASYWGGAPGGARAALLRLPPARTASNTFAYRTPVADAIGWTLVAATGRSLAELVSELIWQPIGAEQDASFVLDTAGHEIAGAGLNATLRDIGRLAQMMLDGGRAGDRQVVPEPIVRALLAGGCRDAFARGGAFPTRPGWSYRSQWWVRHEPEPALVALGVFGQRAHLEPAHRLALVRFGSHPVASSAETDPIHDRALRAIATHLQPECRNKLL